MELKNWMKSINPRVFTLGVTFGAPNKFLFEDNNELEIKQRLSNPKSNQLCKVNTKPKICQPEDFFHEQNDKTEKENI